MPRRCSTCGEPGANVAAFCGRCGARAGGDGRLHAGREPRAPAQPRKSRIRRIRPRDLVTGGLVLAAIGVLAAGLEIDSAAGEVDVPEASRGSSGVTVRALRASPSPAPDLDACDPARARALCVRWQRPRTADQLVVADDATVYQAQPGGSLAALARHTGALRWGTPVGIGDLHDATVGPAGVIVVAGAGGPEAGEAVASLDPRDGSVRWSVVARATVEVEGSAHGPLLFEPSGLRHLDPDTGAERWRWDTNDPAGVELVQGTEHAPIVSTARTLSAIDLGTGAPRWQVSLPQLRGAASGGDGRLVALGGGGGLVGVDQDAGTIDWESRLAFGDRSAVRIVGTDGLVMVEIAPQPGPDGNRTLRVVGVDPTGGSVRWVHLYRTAAERRGMVLTPTTAVLVGTTTAGTIASLDLASGRIVWQRELGPEPAHVRVVGDLVLAASGRNLLLLAAEDGSVVAAARTPSPIIGVVAADDGSAVLKTTTTIVAVAIPTGTATAG